jgi:hypothetical protein
LDLKQENMNVLVLPENSLDDVISLDILYWAKDLEATISMVAHALGTGGRMGLFTNHNIGEVDLPGMLAHSDEFGHRIRVKASCHSGEFEVDLVLPYPRGISTLMCVGARLPGPVSVLPNQMGTT